jgi:hypothetical protein
MNVAQRRYFIRNWIGSGLIVLLAIAAKPAFRFWHLHGFLAYMLAILPALPILWVLFATGAYLAEETDEFQRTVQVQSLLGGIGGTLAVTTVCAYLEDFARAPRLDMIWVYPIFWLFVAICHPVVRARYR